MSSLLLLRPLFPSESLSLPVFACGVRAGFPSPADDYIESRLDLTNLVRNKEATFYARVEGESMTGLGIGHGDLLMIDKSLQAEVGDIVVAEVSNEFTVKQLGVVSGQAYLLPANPKFVAIPISPETGVTIFGVVIHVIKDVRQRRRR